MMFAVGFSTCGRRGMWRPVKMLVSCVSVRYKENWAKLRRKKWATDYALEIFDDSYKNVFGDRWSSIRLALLCQQKYCAVVNNFGDTHSIVQTLQSCGARDVSIEFDSFLEEVRHHFPSSVDGEGVECGVQESEEAVDVCRQENREIDVTASLDEDDRLRFASGKVKSVTSRFQEFVPATRLRGLDDFVNESDFEANYNPTKTVRFETVTMEPVPFPQHWKIYAYDRGDISTFAAPKRNVLGILDYYLMDATSLLPVFALNVQDDDCVLDLCSAPGGKALAILQTMKKVRLTCNDLSQSRVGRLSNVLHSYVPSDDEAFARTFVSSADGRKFINHVDAYNKILVDVPCTTDRQAATVNDNNWFHPIRLKERLKMPQLQIDLLCAALEAVRPGGSVVYSTCTFSPIQNDGVVHMALNRMWETTSNSFVIHDLQQAFRPFSSWFEFHPSPRYGQLVVPTLPNNFGPMYVCKLSKVI